MTGPIRIALLDDYQGLATGLAEWTSLPGDVRVESFTTPARDAEDLVARLQPFDVVVAMRERTPLPASVIDRLPRLRLLVSTGLRNASIDVPACHRRGIVTAGAKGSRHGQRATAETAWALALALCKQLPASQQALREGRWQPHLAGGLAGRTLGIVGLGNIGRQMARIGEAFGMEVIAWSPHLTPERAAEAGVRAVDAGTLFAQSDLVSLHLVLAASTRGLVDRQLLQRMKPDAFLVNTARAGLVDEAALLDVLRDRRIAGAGLDVYWEEPMPLGHPLLALDNVVLTPHLGYATRDNMAAFYASAVEAIRDWLEGRTPTPLAG